MSTLRVTQARVVESEWTALVIGNIEDSVETIQCLVYFLLRDIEHCS